MAERKKPPRKLPADPGTPTKRTSILKIFLTPDELKLIQVAAPLAGESQTEFVRKIAVAKAHQLVADDDFLTDIRSDRSTHKK